LSKIGLDTFDRLLKLLDGSSLSCSADVRDLREDVDAIGRGDRRPDDPSVARDPNRRGRER